MIEMAELRIGNFVNYMESECICAISAIKSSKEVSLIPVEGCKVLPAPETNTRNIGGIVLNNEWLKRFGFITQGSSWEEVHYLSPMFLLKENSGYFMRQSSGYIGRTPIQFVHELQNFYYCLTKQELKIDREKNI
jgi:hypothetical protein